MESLWGLIGPFIWSLTYDHFLVEVIYLGSFLGAEGGALGLLSRIVVSLVGSRGRSYITIRI